MRISDWSSDVCSSDLVCLAADTRPTRFGSIEQAVGELRERLVDAVRLQLRADVPVGAYLSGGLDSSGIVALVRGFTDTPVRTFSRSEERRAGKECVRTFRSRWAP